MTQKKYKATEEQFRKALLKWLNRHHQQLRANVHGDDDTSEWCKDEADLVEQHIQTVESLIFVNDALKTSADEAHRQADLAYDRIEELEAKLAKVEEALERIPDEIDIYRRIKKSGARSHGDIAKVIAAAIRAMKEQCDD